MSTQVKTIEELREAENALHVECDLADNEPPFVQAYWSARQAREQAEADLQSAPQPAPAAIGE